MFFTFFVKDESADIKNIILKYLTQFDLSKINIFSNPDLGQ